MTNRPPLEMKERLLDGDTDPVFCKQVLKYIENMERMYGAACSAADSYRALLHKAYDEAGKQ